jgi:V/A-type H+-transporting ATPase subunit K
MKLWTAALIAVALLAALLAGGATILGLLTPLANAAEAGAATTDPELVRWAFASAAGALAEKPELFGRMLILVGLAEGIAIYGLIVAVLIFNRVG